MASAADVVVAMPEPLATVALDDLRPVLHPSAAADLRRILFYTPERLRPVMACTFAELSVVEWAQRAGLPRTNVTGWLNQTSRIPFGGAVRLSRVIGVPAEELFEGWV
jgi:hypothetical protein